MQVIEYLHRHEGLKVVNVHLCIRICFHYLPLAHWGDPGLSKSFQFAWAWLHPFCSACALMIWTPPRILSLPISMKRVPALLMLRQVRRKWPCGASFFCKVSWTFLSRNFGANGLRPWGSHFCVIPCDEPSSLPGNFNWCHVPLEGLTVWFDTLPAPRRIDRLSEGNLGTRKPTDHTPSARQLIHSHHFSSPVMELLPCGWTDNCSRICGLKPICNSDIRRGCYRSSHGSVHFLLRSLRKLSSLSS